MTVKTKEDVILEKFKADYTAAKPSQNEQAEKIKGWKAEYNGEPYGNEKKGKSKIISRDIKKQSEWQHASLIDPFVSSPDIIKCNPVTWEDRKSAQQNELVLNTQFCRQFNRYNFMTKATKVLDQEGTCVIMTGWEYEEDEQKVTVPQFSIDPLLAQASGIIPEITGYEEVNQTIVKKNKPSAKVCRNEDIFIDPTCQDDFDNAQFIVYRYETDLSTLKSDGRYKNLNKISTTAPSGDTSYDDFEEEDDSVFRFSDEPRKKIVVYEYWGNYDVNNDGIAEPIVCAWVNDVIIRFQDNPFPDGKPPFIIVPFNSIPFTLHGEANAELISDNQKVKTAILRGFIDNMAQSNNAQKGMKKGALDTVNKRRFLNGGNFEYDGLASDFYDGSYNAIPGSAFDVYNLMSNEIESITGVKSFSTGISGNSLGSTATGARGALDATSTRRLNIVRNIAENLVKPLMRKWMSYNSEFLTEGEVIRITNDDFVEIKTDDLKGLIDIDISVSTNEDNNVKAQELAFMMQTMGQSMDLGMRNLIMSEIARLHKMPDLAKQLEEYAPQPDPMEQQERMLQLQLLQAQVENERAKGMENQVDVQLKKAKTANEISKATNLNSKTDMQDLDFLEKESGIDHLKELEKKEFDRMAKSKNQNQAE